MSKTCLVCPEISQASCFCQTPSLQFCEKHLSKHIITPSLVKHKPVYNKTANNNNQKIAIASLNSTKQKMRQMQSQIVNETSVLIAKLESQSKIFLKMLQKLSKKINFTIKTILNSSSADISTTPENIKNILFVLSEKELRNLAKS